MFNRTDLSDELKGLVRNWMKKDFARAARKGRKGKTLRMPPMSPVQQFSGLSNLENRVLLSSNTHGFADADHTFANLDLTAGANGVISVLDDTDDGSASINLGSDTFTFYGNQFTGANQLFVSDNGLITFATGNSSPTNSNLSSSPSQAAIAVSWDDWRTDAGANDQVLAKFVDVNNDGTNDQLIIEWNDVVHATGGGAVTFQAVLRLNTGATDGDIVLNYIDSTTGNSAANGGSSTVGLKNSNGAGADALLVSFNTGNAALFGDGQSLRLATTALDVTAPTVSIGDIAPDPRNSAVSSVTITFSEAVAGFNLADLSLTRDGGSNLLTGSESLTTGDGGTTWTLSGISGLTGADGEYTLTLTADQSGIIDSQLNFLAVGDADAWTVETVVPTATISPVSPDPSAGAVNSIVITFSEAVTGFTAADLSLTLDGGANLLNGSETLNSGDNITFTLSNLAALTGADGAYVLTLTSLASGIQDAAANLLAANAVEAFVVDTIAPSAPGTPDLDADDDSGTSSSDNLTNQTLPTLTGTGEANATIEIFVDGVSDGTTAADGSGNWSYTIQNALAAGVRTITAKATDAAGNQSVASTGLDVTVDTTSPSATSTPDLATASDTGFSDNDDLTNDTTPTFSGTAEANSIVKIFANGALVGTGAANGAGNWSITTSALSDGVQVITATSTDAAGNVSVASTQLDVVIDTAAPSASSTPDLDAGNDSGVSSTDNVTNVTTPTFAGTAEAFSTVEIFVDGVSDGATLADGSGNWSYTIQTPLTEGTRAITATVTDAAGNVSSASSALNVNVDATAPTADVVDVAPDPRNKTVKTIAINFNETVSGFALEDLALTFDAGSNLLTGSQTLTTSDNASFTLGNLGGITGGQGAFALTLAAAGAGVTDLAGNALVANASDAWDTDTVLPTISITAVSPDPRNSTVATITIVASEAISNFGIEDLTFTRNGGSNLLGGGQSLTTGDNITFTLTGLAALTGVDGTYVLTLDALTAGIEDGAANLLETGDSTSFVADFTPPATPSTPDLISADDSGTSDTDNLTSLVTPTVQGTAEVGSVVSIFVGGVLDGQVNPDANGDWNYTIDGPLVTGNNLITVTATDAAGNESSVSGTLTIVIDVTAPSAPSTPDLAAGSDSGSSNSDDNTSDTTPTFTGTAEADSIVKIFIDGVEAGSGVATGGNYSITVNVLPDGVFAVTSTATDAAGNTSGASSALSLTVDTTAPSAPSTPDLTSGDDSGSSNSDDLTSNTTPGLSGTAEAGAGIEIFVDGVSDGTASADGSGNWTYTIQGALATGARVITAKATDAAGNVSVASTGLTVTIDTTAPSAPSAADLAAASDTGTLDSDDLTNDTTPTLAGTAEANASIEVFVDGVSDGTTSADGSGDWTYTIQSALTTGVRTITAKATDAAGNESVASTGLDVTIDVTAPSAPSTPDLAAGSDSGSSNSDDNTSDTTPTFTGTAEADSIVKIFIDGVEAGSGVATGGNYSITVNVLPDGVFAVTSTATDAAGNTSGASSALSLTVDTTAPSAPSTPDLTSGDDSGSSNSDNVTSNTTPGVSGTAEANSSIEIFVDGVSDGTATANGAGAWTYTIQNALSEGARTITARATDAAGNVSVASTGFSVTVDTTAPSAPSAADLAAASDTGTLDSDDLTNDTTPTLSGTAEANASIEVFVDGVSDGTTSADGSGNWTYTIQSALSTGVRTITAKATDAAGNESVASTGLDVTIDVTAPSAPSTPDLAAGSDSGSFNTDNNTSDTTPTFTGTAEANSIVKFFVAGVQVGSGVADGGGNYSVTVNAMADGTFVFTSTATDAAGNTSVASGGLTVTVDTTAPVAPTTPDLAGGDDTGSSNSDNITSDTAPNISGTAEANSTVEIYVDGVSDGTATANGAGAWSHTIQTPLASGARVITAKATDPAGNVSVASTGLTVTVDTAAPSAPSTPDLTAGSDTGTLDSDNLTNDSTPTLAGTAEANAIVEVFVDGVSDGTTTADANGDWTYTIQSALTTGVRAITARATDAAGNQSVASSGLNVTIDVTAPSTPSTPDLAAGSDSGSSSSDDNTSDNTPTFTGTAEADSIVRIFIDGVEAASGVATGGNYSITLSALPDGGFAVTSTATDAAGNASSASSALSLTVDTTAPSAPSTPDLAGGDDSGFSNSDNITSDTLPAVSGTAEANASIEIFVDGVSDGTTTANGAGAWSYTIQNALSQGARTITARATDAAGNVSIASTGLSVTVDTTAPSAPSAADLAAASDTGTLDSDNLTNDSTPTLSGTAEANAVVEVFVDGISDGTTSADGNGDWNYTIQSALTTGVRTITARASDAAGNQSVAGAGLDVTIDVTAPSTPTTPDLATASDSGISDNDEITTDTTPTFNGTAEADSIVKIFIDGVEAGSGVATGGNYSITLNVLPDGVFAVTATATDAAGNVSAATSALTLTVDTTAPSAPSAPDLVSGDDSGTSSSDNLTNVTTPGISGTAEANSTVEIFVDGVSDGATLADGSGNWSYTIQNALPTGASTITARATDAAGNVSVASTGLTVTVDTAAPSAPTTPDLTAGTDSGTLDSDNLTNDSTPTFTGTAEANAVVKVFVDGALDGSTTADGSGNWSYTIQSALSTGARDITATATDAAGNASSASSALTITIDVTAPSAPTTPDLASGSDSGSSSSDNNTNDTTPTFTGTAEADSIVKIFIDGVEAGSGVATGGNYSITLNVLPDGVYAVTSTATDAAGNTSAISSGLSITVDAAAPSAPSTPDLASGDDSGTSNSDNLTNDTTPGISGTAEANSTVEIFVDGVSDGTTTANGEGAWTYTIQNALSSGARTITAKATDTAGNVSVASTGVTLTIDNTAPSAPVTDLADASDTGPSTSDNTTNDNTPTVNGTAEANAAIEVFVNSSSVGTTTADANGDWSFTFETLADGTHTVTAKATDAAGNVSATSTDLAVTVDTVSPTVDITDVTPDPRETTVDTITIVFSEAVAGFTLADLSLTLSGGSNLLTGAQTLTTNDNITFTLGNLAGLTGVGGTLTLTLTGSGVTDTAGNVSGDATDSWQFNTLPPTLTTVSTLAGAVKNTAFTITYASLAAAANEADVDGGLILFKVASVTTGTLTKNGTAVVAGTTTLAPGEELVWTPANNALGTLNAFKIRANDTFDDSAADVQVKVTVTNPTVSLTGVDLAGTEDGSGTATFQVTRNGTTASALTVVFALTGTAGNGLDYATLNSSVVIPAGQASATVTITPTDDVIFEAAETVIVTLGNSVNYLVDANNKTATATIADDEPTVSVTANDPDATEAGLTPGQFTVALSHAVNQDVKVFYTVTGTAGNNVDYTTITNFVIIAAGQTSAVINVTPRQDATKENAETVIVTLTANAAYGINNDAKTATVTLADDEPTVSIAANDAAAAESDLTTGQFTITLSNAVTQDVRVNFTVTGTAGNGIDYNAVTNFVIIPAGQTTATVTITPKQDALNETDNETVILTLTPALTYAVDSANKTATVNVVDDEPTVSITATDDTATEAGLTTGQFTVTLSNAVTQDVKVLFTIGGTAGNNVDYTTIANFVTIPAGQTSATVTITPKQDALNETDAETVVLTLANSTAYAVDANAKTATVNVADDEPTVSITANDDAATEAGLTTGQFTVTLSNAVSQDVKVLFTIGGTAGNNVDYTTIANFVTIPAGQTSATVTITPKQDAIAENAEAVTLTLANSTAYAVDANAKVATVTVADDEPTVSIAATDATASEEGLETGQFTVTLSNAVSQDVKVFFTIGGTAAHGIDVAAITTFVIIPAGQTSATVTVTPRQDTVVENSETVVATLVAQSTYRVDQANKAATVTLADNEPTVSIATTGPIGSENGNTPGEVTITRTGGTDTALTVFLTILGTAVNGVDYNALLTAVTIPAGQSSLVLPITPKTDALNENDETVIVRLRAGTTYRIDGEASEALVTIEDIA